MNLILMFYMFTYQKDSVLTDFRTGEYSYNHAPSLCALKRHCVPGMDAEGCRNGAQIKGEHK